MSNLFILATFLGDSILTASGIIDRLKDEPSVIIANSQTAPLFEDLPNLEKLIIMKKKPWKQHWIEAWQETRGKSWNRIFDCRKSGLRHCLKAREKYVWQDSASSSLHVIEQVSQCFGSTTPLSPALWVSEERLRRIKPNRPVFAVAPIPGWKGKQWPIENFITLLQTFCETYPEAQVAVFSAPHEKELITPLVEALPENQHLDVRGWPLLDCIALVQSSRLFIGNDSGLMHASVSVKTPTLALFGPSNEKIYGPWSDQTPSPHRTLRGEPFTVNVHQCPTNTQNYMTSLLVPQVWDAVKEMWDALTIHQFVR